MTSPEVGPYDTLYTNCRTTIPDCPTWPKGRLVAKAAPDVGEFSTIGFLAPGRKVLIHAATRRAGGIQVEVAADPKGKTIPGHSFADCKPIIGDCYRTTVTWNGQEDLGYKEGTPIILRFRMRNAQIFGLDFVRGGPKTQQIPDCRRWLMHW